MDEPFNFDIDMDFESSFETSWKWLQPPKSTASEVVSPESVVKTKTARCTNLGLMVKHRKWLPEEDKKLVDAMEESKERRGAIRGFWDDVVSRSGLERTASQCRARFRVALDTRVCSCSLTQTERLIAKKFLRKRGGNTSYPFAMAASVLRRLEKHTCPNGAVGRLRRSDVVKYACQKNTKSTEHDVEKTCHVPIPPYSTCKSWMLADEEDRATIVSGKVFLASKRSPKQESSVAASKEEEDDDECLIDASDMFEDALRSDETDLEVSDEDPICVNAVPVDNKAAPPLPCFVASEDEKNKGFSDPLFARRVGATDSGKTQVRFRFKIVDSTSFPLETSWTRSSNRGVKHALAPGHSLFLQSTSFALFSQQVKNVFYKPRTAHKRKVVLATPASLRPCAFSPVL